ncbi:MAG: hypothetical protein K8I29_01615 [Alphaproteobacteria bacterium]|uniref:Uncharacterized protein n=1 Tax=Candidatus Nitrobium versatile TaxID=2884831 RepID=A0A953JBM8_9BACT|nr:hypothetical protein [Candidatus Nitrobium versatile]
MKKEAKIIKANISGALTDSELRDIKLFLKRVDELAHTEIMSGKVSNISLSVRAKKDASIEFTVSLPKEDYLRSFYMAFRFFYLQKEKTNFLRIANIVNRRTDNEMSRKYVERLKDIWSGALARQQMQLYINDTEITPTMLIDLWFNAHYFHSDESKEKNLTNLKKALTIDVCRFMLADAVYEASKAVIHLANSLQTFAEKSD